MKVSGAHILVEVEKLLENTIKAKGGTEFLLDNSFEPRKYKRCYGIVYACPEKFSGDVEMRRLEESVLQSLESYQYHNPIVFTSADIPQIIKNGDKVWFYYSSTEENQKIVIDNKEIYRMPPNEIICVIREGKILATNGHAFLEPFYGDDVEIEEVEGKKTILRKKGGIITETNIKPVPQIGIVKYISDPLDGDEIGYQVGDKVYFKDFANLQMTIEGENLYVMRYWDVLAKIND